ncbi:MAG: hypothetical protein ACFB0G_20845 [Leptolyngbyaceae cyanobacterium]
MATQIDDVTLIKHFIEGDTVLAANYRLRLQPAQDMFQLLSRSGQLIAWAQHTACPARIGVSAVNDYAKLIGKLLMADQFIPVGPDTTGRYMTYEYHPAPHEDEIRYTPARDFWKYWWCHRRRLVGPHKDTEIMAFMNRQWQRVQDVAFHAETLFITTAEGDAALQNQDRLVWSQPTCSSEQASEKTEQVFEDMTKRLAPSLPPVPELSASIPMAAIRPGLELELSTPNQLNQSLEVSTDETLRALSYISQVSDQQVMVETPHGHIVITGDRLAVSLACHLSRASTVKN